MLPHFAAVLACVCFTEAATAQIRYATHPPMRPLPVATQRPMDKGPARFVDPVKGDDRHDGAEARPWKTLTHAFTEVRPGMTLYLRGGVYYEHATLKVRADAAAPVTIRSYPGELAIVDGGLREFCENPAKAWMPCPGGAEGEFCSTSIFPDLGGSAASTNVLGRFGDSMVPLHGYRFLSDLCSANIYWNVPKNTEESKDGIYCGPGVFYDVTTGRLHVRLAPTRMKYLPAADNYTGESDPRKTPLVIAGLKGGPVLSFRDCSYVRVQDVVVRGARAAAIEISSGENLEFDGLTVYGGQSCFTVRDTAGLRVLNTACRGIAAPWTFRGSLKYRAFEARIFSASGWSPTGLDSRDFELAWSEFTDSVDGVFLGNVYNVRFHHNLVENITDDAIFLTAGTAYDGTTPGGKHHFTQNRVSHCLTTFAFGVGHGRQKGIEGGMQTGEGAWIARNVFDFRKPVLYHQPTGPDVPQEVKSKGRIAGDHGGPAWEPMFSYHNTILADDPAIYAYGTAGLADHTGTTAPRRAFNNIVVQLTGLPGMFPQPADRDVHVDANLFWSMGKGPGFQGDLFTKFRASPAFLASKKRFPPGLGLNDRFTDPKFVAFDGKVDSVADLRLDSGSPAVDAGIDVPKEWPDPLRAADNGKPDLGAIPAGVAPWHVGVRGRLTMFGEEKAAPPSVKSLDFLPRSRPLPKQSGLRAAIVEGYPARDVPLLAYALRKLGADVEIHERKWLDPAEYPKFQLVAIGHDLVRAKTTPNRYQAKDLVYVDQFLRDGGTLILMLRGKEVFNTPEGKAYLLPIIGEAAPKKDIDLQVLAPRHPWLKHLKPEVTRDWLGKGVPTAEFVLRTSKGDRLIGTPEGHASLYRTQVGKGQIIYIGWEIAHSLPATRDQRPTVHGEEVFEEQMRILLNVAEEGMRR